MPKKSKKVIWSENKKLGAQAMAEGTETQTEIAKRLGVQESTVSRWKHDPDFLIKVDELTLALERHTLAGMLRRIDEKQKETTVKKDEWTKLEELKGKWLGFDKQKVEHTGSVDLNENKTVDVNIDEKLAKEFGDWLVTEKTIDKKVN